MADFTELTQSAASKAAESGVRAETEYDVKRAEAKRDYHGAVADANLAKVSTEQNAHLAYTLGQITASARDAAL